MFFLFLKIIVVGGGVVGFFGVLVVVFYNYVNILEVG